MVAVSSRSAPTATDARRIGRVPATRWWLITGAVAALIPMVRMARSVVSGSPVQYADYWLMLPEVLDHGGGLRWRGLFTFSNDHAVVIPKLLYWLNVQVAGGSNITLGLYVVGVAGAQVVLVWTVLRRSPFGDAARAGLIVVASALVFNRLGAWNFLKAMSGTAWLTANAFAVAAIVLRVRGRIWMACLVGGLASISYGTGLAVWPAIVVAGLATDRSTMNRRITTAVGAIVVVGYLALRTTSDDRSPTIAGPVRLVRFTAQVLGGSLVRFDSPDAEWLGFALVAVGAWATFAVVRAGRQREAAPWLGFAVFGVAASATVAAGRADFIIGLGSNRHASLGSIAILGVAGLVALAVRFVAGGVDRATERSAGAAIADACALAALVGAITFSSGSELDRIESERVHQDRFAINVLLGIAGGTREQMGRLDAVPDGIEELLESSGHVPFAGGHRFDCGRIGERLDVDDLARTVPDAVQVRLEPRTRRIERALLSSGWLEDPDGRVECILALDPAGNVVGAGTIGPADDGYGPDGGLDAGRPDGWSDGFVIVRPAGTNVESTVLVLDDGQVVVVPQPD